MSISQPSLSVATIVNVQLEVAPLSAQVRDFNSLLILGNSPTIDTQERRRLYTSIEDVAGDFLTTSHEYLAALLFFSQAPRPVTLQIGRWAKTATAGRLVGAARSTAQQALSIFTAITSGGFAIDIDGTTRTLTGINLSTATNLNGVAAAVQTALSTWATCIWNPTLARFEITSTTTGTSSEVEAVATATPLATALGITAVQTPRSVVGIAAESLAACAAIFSDAFTDWYGLLVAEPLTAEADILPLAAFIEAASPARILAHTTQAPGTLDAAVTNDLASQLRALGYERTFVQYSSSSPYAAASSFARAFAVDFTGSLTAITLKFKQLPGVAAERLTQTQATALVNKRCNVFVAFDNDTSILKEGVMSSGEFFDTRHGTDWLANALQTDVYNALYTSTTKIPQTDAGVNELLTVASNRMAAAVENGLLAPGQWNASGFGQLTRGQYLPTGFYIYAPPIRLQAQSDREARKSPLIQIAAKLAGAIHSADLIIRVNR
jgi:hypothetical protein